MGTARAVLAVFSAPAVTAQPRSAALWAEVLGTAVLADRVADAHSTVIPVMPVFALPSDAAEPAVPPLPPMRADFCADALGARRSSLSMKAIRGTNALSTLSPQAQMLAHLRPAAAHAHRLPPPVHAARRDRRDRRPVRHEGGGAPQAGSSRQHWFLSSASSLTFHEFHMLGNERKSSEVNGSCEFPSCRVRTNASCSSYFCAPPCGRTDVPM